MSDSNKVEGNVAKSKTNAQSKKKERRQKTKSQSGDDNTITADKEIVSEETVKAIEQNAEASGSATSSNATDLIDEIKLKSLLDEAYKYKANPNILPSILRDAAKTPQEAMHKSFKFWYTQPVPKFDETTEKNEAIEPNKEIVEIRSDPYALPDGFKWETMKLDDPLVLTELYTLLNENYVEDDDAMFRFDYQPEFLKWALQPPGWRPGKLSEILNVICLVSLEIYRFFQIGTWAFASLSLVYWSVSFRQFPVIFAFMTNRRRLLKSIFYVFIKNCVQNVLHRY